LKCTKCGRALAVIAYAVYLPGVKYSVSELILDKSPTTETLSRHHLPDLKACLCSACVRDWEGLDGYHEMGIYHGVCRRCGAPLQPGEEVVRHGNWTQILCPGCAEKYEQTGSWLLYALGALFLLGIIAVILSMAWH
jgi:hypothetical protein